MRSCASAQFTAMLINLTANKLCKTKTSISKKSCIPAGTRWKQSLHTISVAELKALTDELFPYTDHPWFEKFSEVISDPTSGTFHHAVVDDYIHVLYCQGKDIGLWFIPDMGKGPLQPERVKDHA